jgi:peptidoglycan/LPS O-acetylase OafA/YrhL
LGALRILPCFLLGCALHSLWRSGALRGGKCGGLALGFLAWAAQPPTYLGEISYSIYMVCAPWGTVFTHSAQKLLNLPGDRLPWPVWTLLVLGLIPVAAASYHLLEKPARAWLKGRFEPDAERPLVNASKG